MKELIKAANNNDIKTLYEEVNRPTPGLTTTYFVDEDKVVYRIKFMYEDKCKLIICEHVTNE